jgi:hypothetical protein
MNSSAVPTELTFEDELGTKNKMELKKIQCVTDKP